GPLANRLRDARFKLGDETYQIPPNEGPNLLHGGAQGLSRALWRTDRDGDRAVRFSLTRAHLEDGFPGDRLFEVEVRLTGYLVRYDMRCRTDRPTVVNLAQHNYYSVGLDRPMWSAGLQIDADAYTPVGADLLPTGEIAPVDGTDFDLREMQRLDRADRDQCGLDLNYVVTPKGDAPVARMQASNGLVLRMWSDQPGLQLYTGGGLRAVGRPLAGQTHASFCGICLEPQGFPDSPNNATFPSVVITPDAPYRQSLEIEIAPEETA
ncbi:MAG: galactose mutarotase, partial [Pseudomonadota bacterium]